MTIANAEIQVTWSSSNSVSVSSGSNSTSDAHNISATAIDLSVELKADNDGTPASGDTVDFYVLPTVGDPDGASSDEYATAGHAIFLARLDTNTEDPAITVARLNPTVKSVKIRAVNNSAGRAITVSAALYEKTG